MFVYRAQPLCRLRAAGGPAVNKSSYPRAKATPPPTPLPTQLLALSHALAAPLYPLFKITGVEAMKGGWRRGGALFRKLSSVQFWQRRPRWTDLFYLFYQWGSRRRAAPSPPASIWTHNHLNKQNTPQILPRIQGHSQGAFSPFRAERETRTRVCCKCHANNR